jgi:arylsulfatase
MDGTGTLKVDGKTVATEKIEHTLPLTKPLDTVYNIGAASGTPVDDKDYQVPFTFTGKINKITVALDRPQLSPADIKKLQQAENDIKANK